MDQHARLRAMVEEFDAEPEVPASAGGLYAASNVIGTACKEPSFAYLSCKAQDADPMACVKEGREVTRCALSVFRAIYASPCAAAFDSYVTALEKRNLQFDMTRREEAAFDQCWAKQTQDKK